MTSASGDLIFSFNIVSDLHIGANSAYSLEHIESAFEVFKKNNPSGSFIVTVGDHADHGKPEEFDVLYDAYKKSNVNIPMYLTLGNHDRRVPNFEDVFKYNVKRFSGVDLYKTCYKVTFKGFTFLFINPTSPADYGTVFVNEEIFEWFKKEFELAKGEGNRIFVIIHEPFLNTVAGSYADQHWSGVPKDLPGNFYNEIKKVCDTYSSCIVLSGHTHWSVIEDNNVLQCDSNTANYVNCSSTSYLWWGLDKGHGIKDDNDRYIGSEAYTVFVYNDKVVFKSWNLDNKEFINEFIIDLE